MENIKKQFELQIGSIVSVNRFYTKTDFVEKFIGRIGKITSIQNRDSKTFYEVDFGELGVCKCLFFSELVPIMVNIELLRLLGFNYYSEATQIKNDTPLYYKHGYPYEIFVEQTGLIFNYWFGIIPDTLLESKKKNNKIEYLDELIGRLNDSDIGDGISLILGKEAEFAFLK